MWQASEPLDPSSSCNSAFIRTPFVNQMHSYLLKFISALSNNRPLPVGVIYQMNNYMLIWKDNPAPCCTVLNSMSRDLPSFSSTPSISIHLTQIFCFLRLLTLIHRGHVCYLCWHRQVQYTTCSPHLTDNYACFSSIFNLICWTLIPPGIKILTPPTMKHCSWS